MLKSRFLGSGFFLGDRIITVSGKHPLAMAPDFLMHCIRRQIAITRPGHDAIDDLDPPELFLISQRREDAPEETGEEPDRTCHSIAEANL
jgi:hypothetical protein